MKYTYLIVAALAAFTITSCGGPKANESGEAGIVAETDSTAHLYAVDAAASSVKWRGSKTTGADHVGTVNIKSGDLAVKNGVLQSGRFVIDMTSINNTDLANDPDGYGKLMGHLKSDAFFAVDSFSEAMFEITEAASMTPDTAGNNQMVKGNLTIRGITRLISFPAKVIENENAVTANAYVVINRLDWNVNWKKEEASLSEKALAAMKEGVTKKEIELTINLSGKRS